MFVTWGNVLVANREGVFLLSHAIVFRQRFSMFIRINVHGVGRYGVTTVWTDTGGSRLVLFTLFAILCIDLGFSMWRENDRAVFTSAVHGNSHFLKVAWPATESHVIRQIASTWQRKVTCACVRSRSSQKYIKVQTGRLHESLVTQEQKSQNGDEKIGHQGRDYSAALCHSSSRHIIMSRSSLGRVRIAGPV